MSCKQKNWQFVQLIFALNYIRARIISKVLPLCPQLQLCLFPIKQQFTVKRFCMRFRRIWIWLPIQENTVNLFSDVLLCLFSVTMTLTRTGSLKWMDGPVCLKQLLAVSGSCRLIRTGWGLSKQLR